LSAIALNRWLHSTLFPVASQFSAAYDANMASIEFETELRGEPALPLPPEVAARLPKSGRAKVVLLIQDDEEDEQWRRAAYEQFMKDDVPEDAVYDAYQ
jgi:hypothetical protein